jgi:hypothetical protein
MIAVDGITHYAAHRFGLVDAAGGKLVKPARVEMDNNAQQVVGGIGGAAEVKEFATAGGEVVSRKVVALGSALFWLRRDLADAAAAALEAEKREHARVISEMRDFISETDRQGAARNGVSVEQYRINRHNAGARWDRYRAVQRAGY